MASQLAAAVQMTSSGDKGQNIDTAVWLVEQAAERGAALVALPELFNCLSEPESIVSHAEPVPGPTTDRMAQLARECKVTLVAGSIAERSEDPQKIYNTSLLFAPDGALLARYRKLHLFDIDLPGEVTFRESDFIQPGDRIAVTDTPCGRLGQATCYDLRFPELFRRLVEQGAELFVVPSAFTMATGRDHWEVLLRARAIENQVYIVAPNQYGRHTSRIQTYGRSAIVDPWGTVLAKGPDTECVVLAELDPMRLEQVRTRLPSLEHRREFSS